MKNKTTKRLKPKLQKAAQGLNDVAVPEAGSVGNVLSSGLSLASTGASIGGPWGAAGGAALGLTMGLIQKNKQDELYESALRVNQDNKLNRQFDGVESTINQKMQTYKKGSKKLKAKASKLIEAEHNEHVFDDQLNHKGVVQGNTHKEGGEVIKVEEGDSIFPAKHKSKVDTHLKTGNKQAIKKIRNKLPKDVDKSGKAAFGASDIDIPDPVAYAKRNKTIKPIIENGSPLYADNKNRNGQYGTYNQAVSGLNAGTSTYLNRGDKGNPYPYSVVKDAGGTMYKHNMDYSPLSTIGATPSTGSIPSTVSTLNLQNGLPANPANNPGEGESTTNELGDTSTMNPTNVLKYANIANNLIQGFQTPKPIEQNYLDPSLLKYTDRSETLRRDSRGNERIQASNARNLSGGMASNIRANQAAAGSTNLENQDSINEREMGRADQIDNANIEIKNRAKELNLNRKDFYTDQLLKQRATQDQFRNAGIQELASQAEVNERDNYARSRDAKEDQKDNDTLAYLNQTTRYKIDPTTKTINFNPNSQSTGSSLATPKTSTTTSVDAKGRESTRATTSSGGDKSIISSIGRTLKRSRKLR